MKSLLAAIENQESLATRRDMLEDRADALDHYLGKPYGDEIEGRSSVVMRDIADTIEWIKPSLMEVFCSGDDYVRFVPRGPEDEEQAEQETDYINHIVMEKNPGFLIFHDWFHDALLQRNGYVYPEAVKSSRQQRAQYQGLSDDEFALLLQGEVELLEHTATQTELGTYHDAVVRKTEEYSCIRISNIPPERVLVAADWPGVSLEGCPFVEVVDYKTVSQLREQGYDVDDNISDTGGEDDDDYIEQRRSVDDDDYMSREDLGADAATKRLRVRYVWMNWDQDEDGIAELRRIVVVGKTILENEEDDLIPLACLTPFRQPHEHYGQSVADIVQDLQRIHTVLMRQLLDNTYLSNNSRKAVNIENVNLDDLLTDRPGGVVRTKGNPADSIMPLMAPPIGQDILAAMEVIDQVRERRTGVNKNTQGIEANALAVGDKTATEASQLHSSAQQRIRMLARIFAETGVKSLFLIIRALTLKNGQQREIVKLRNKWVPVDPSTWPEQRDSVCEVGIGQGDSASQMVVLMQVMGMQEKALMGGLTIVNPSTIYNAAKRFVKLAGFKNPDDFFVDPSTVEPPQPKPDPEMMKEQAKAQGAAQVAQIQAQVSMQVEQFKAQKQQETELAAQQAQQAQVQAQAETQAHLDRFKAEVNAQVERYKADHARDIEMLRQQAEDLRNQRDNATKLQIAQMGHQASLQAAAMAPEPQ